MMPILVFGQTRRGEIGGSFMTWKKCGFGGSSECRFLREAQDRFFDFADHGGTAVRCAQDDAAPQAGLKRDQ